MITRPPRSTRTGSPSHYTPLFRAMLLTADHFTAVFWIAVIPAVMAAGLIIFAVHEPDDHRSRVSKARSPLSRAQLWRLGAEYWWVVAVATVFTLARFSEA